MKIKHTLILLSISVLTTVYFLKCRTNTPVSISKVDTVIKYIHVSDTVFKRSIVKLPGETDTLWKDSVIYIPDTSYPKLLEQYKKLGNQYFTKNTYSTTFKIEYGSVKVIDTIQANKLISSALELDVKIPEKIVTIEKQPLPKREFYTGTYILGNKINIISGVGTGILYKDKKDKIYGVSIGWTPQGVEYGLSTYFKLQ
jgi:hypothetical protein